MLVYIDKMSKYGQRNNRLSQNRQYHLQFTHSSIPFVALIELRPIQAVTQLFCHFQLYSSHDDYNCTIQGSLFHLIPIASIHFFNWGPWQRAHGVLNECYSIVNAEK